MGPRVGTSQDLAPHRSLRGHSGTLAQRTVIVRSKVPHSATSRWGPFDTSSTCTRRSEGGHSSAVDVPETRYARSGEVSIAYQALGNGPPDLVFAPPITHLELDWECLSVAQFYSRLASASRLILFNLRGVGMSDRIPGVATLESRMDDIRAVMDATESERAVIFGLGPLQRPGARRV